MLVHQTPLAARTRAERRSRETCWHESQLTFVLTDQGADIPEWRPSSNAAFDAQRLNKVAIRRMTCVLGAGSCDYSLAL
jgi:hypothetical protein